MKNVRFVGLDVQLSLLSRLAAAVQYPRLRTVRYSGVLASASKLRTKIAPKQEPVAAEGEVKCMHSAIAWEMPDELPKRGPYRPWAELLKRTFHVDVLQCPNCQGRTRLLAVLTEASEVRRYLRAIGEQTELPAQAPARAPPYWTSVTPRPGTSRRAAPHVLPGPRRLAVVLRGADFVR